MAIDEATMERAKRLLADSVENKCKCGVCLANVYLRLRIADQIAADAATHDKEAL